MPEYIEREAVLKHSRPIEVGAFSEIDVVTVENIKSVPAADVEVVRHGEWIKKHLFSMNYDDWFEYTCSECNEHYRDYEKFPKNYCPHCGARMDGKGEGE